MNTFLFWLAVVTVASFLLVAVELLRGRGQLRYLAAVEPLPQAELPLVSVVVAARDEERNVEEAMGSILAQDLADIELVVVDDRSADRTGEILDRMAAADPRLRVVHVRELPAGWLGKNHALDLGAADARGELILFTDADVVMAPDTVRLAASYMERERLDHLTMAPRIDMPGFLLQAFGVLFGICFLLFSRPWKARDPRSASHIGIGAFNLVRASSYRHVGTHRAIAMRPDDDMKLGKLMKKNGQRQDFLVAVNHVSVEWYRSIPEAVRGLRKNGFAGLDYRVSMVVFATLTQLAFMIFPFIAIFLTTGPTRLLYAFSVAMILGLFGGAAREQRAPVWGGIAVPFASLLFIVIVWNATLYALIHRGIEWRGTHYPLDELRANRV
ncbi:MAG TPA: glycosyltransferase family 2 protein [Longimicrobium sp.]|jgi:glycosyltransferase involved in cell wall biosynthesis